jgi:hypothetical protein
MAFTGLYTQLLINITGTEQFILNKPLIWVYDQVEEDRVEEDKVEDRQNLIFIKVTN